MIKRDKLGRFIKGSSNAWNKGLTKEIDERVKKMALTSLGRNKGEKHPMYGKHHTKKSKKKISLNKKGKSLWPNGRIFSEETKKKMSKSGKERIKKGRGAPTFKKGKENVAYKLSKEERKQKRAKQNPTFTSSIEIKIQNFLKQLKIEFFTHQYIKEIEHGYQCDILIPSMNLVIECDGNYWHKYPIGNDIDHIRTKELIEKGFKVLRLWEFEIKSMDINQFKNKLTKNYNGRHKAQHNL